MPWRDTGGRVLRIVAALLLLFGLYVAQTYSYLLFHSLVEIFSVAVAVALLMLAWNSRHFVERDFLLWIGIGYGFVAIIDLVHTLVYRGMGVFGDLGADPPTQLWIAARFIQALVLLIAPVFLSRKLNARAALAGFSVVVTLVFVSVFGWNIFPQAYNDAAGHLTTFKIVSEYIICALLLCAIGWIVSQREQFDRHVLALLIGSIVSTLLGEFSFTLYTDPYGFTNLLGHYLKLVAFYLLYKAVVEANLRRPYEVLFRDLTQREDELARSQRELEALNHTLEERVAERTTQVRTLARELTQVETRERERLADILHDDLQQTLAAARMRVKMAMSRPEGAAEVLAQADEHIAEAIERSRCLAVEVSSGVVRELGFDGALHWLGEHMAERHGLSVEVTTSEVTDLGDPDVEALVFRVVRELLFNVVKHAGADSATVCASRNGDGELCVTVSDTGRGFRVEAATANSGGFGLSSVRGHVEMLGGTCAICSEPGEGTQVTMAFPIGAE